MPPPVAQHHLSLSSQTMGLDRYKNSVLRRHRALDLSRPPIPTRTNGDEQQFAGVSGVVFAKGLIHDRLGRVRRSDMTRFYMAIEAAQPVALDMLEDLLDTRPAYTQGPQGPWPRARWEGPHEGHGFALQGPDAGSVAMPPAPELGSDQQVTELAQLYALSLLRDVPFTQFEAAQAGTSDLAGADVQALNLLLGTLKADLGLDPRGMTQGPILSQFLLRGTGGCASVQYAGPESGVLRFGAQQMSQQVMRPTQGQDYMADWTEWLDVQCGADTRAAAEMAPGRGFIRTPRDLAWFVRDALPFQVFVNAGYILLSEGAAGATGLYGGGMLARLAESGMQVLQAVMRQKTLHHRRARPEALAAITSLWANGHGAGDPARRALEEPMRAHLKGLTCLKTPDGTALLDLVATRTADIGARYRRGRRLRTPVLTRNLLLPMAYPEGAPLTPSYGSAHAAVAGACATLLKATFQMYVDAQSWEPLRLSHVGQGAMTQVYDVAEDGTSLHARAEVSTLTVQDEINKLARNIGLGRMVAGVSYASDVTEGLRFGEEIAIALLHEQMLTFPPGTVVRFERFDGTRVTLRASAADGARICCDPMPDWVS